MFLKIALIFMGATLSVWGQPPQSMHEAGSRRPQAEPERPVYLVVLKEKRIEKVLPDEQGKYKLKPRRVYMRYEPLVQNWVYDLTTAEGGFVDAPPRMMLKGSQMPGEWLGGNKKYTFQFDPEGEGLDAWVQHQRGKHQVRYIYFHDPREYLIQLYDIQ